MARHYFGLFFGLLLIAGCHVQVDDQQLLLLHDPAADQLALLFTHRGVASQNTSKALGEIEGMLDGGRTIGLAWPFYINLDGEVADFSPEDKALAAGVSVLAHGLFLDGEGRLCGYQQVVIKGIDGVVARANELVNTALRQEFGPLEPLEAAEPQAASDNSAVERRQYPRTQRRWLAAARGDWSWIALVEGRVVVRIPLDPLDVGLLTEDLLREGGETLKEEGFAGAGLRGLLRAISNVQLTEGVLELTFAPDAQGIIALRFDDQVKGPWDPALLGAIQATQRWELEATQSPAELRARLLSQLGH